MSCWISVLQNHVMAANYYFIITDNNRTKRTSITAIDSPIGFFHCFCQEFVVPVLYGCKSCENVCFYSFLAVLYIFQFNKD